MAENDRFVKTYSQGGFLSNLVEIWVDKKTGVNYLFASAGQAAGLTVMLKSDGTPVVTPLSQLTDD